MIKQCTCEVGNLLDDVVREADPACPIHGDDETDGSAPTAWAYNQACRALDRKTAMLRRIRELNRPESRYWIRADDQSVEGVWMIPWDAIERILDGD